MKLQVNRIVNYLITAKRPVVALLKDGLDVNVVEQLMKKILLDPPADLIKLYECFNGTKIKAGDSLDDTHFFPGFYWLCLEDAIESYTSFIADNRWGKSWLPIFSNGGGDFYVVVCDKDSPIFGSVIGFMLGEDEHFIEFPNLSTMLCVIDECFAKGIYYVSDGFLDADYNAAMLVAKRFCPELEFYN